MKVSITTADIAAGRPSQARCCPFALALFRQTGNGLIIVGTWCAWVGDRGYLLPGEAREWIQAFDRCEAVTPAEFELEEFRTC